MIEVNSAKDIIRENTPIADTIEMDLLSAAGFSLAEDIISDRDYPPFNRSAMDGYAICFEDYSKSRQFTVDGVVYAGDNWHAEAEKFHCIKIMTGAAVPKGYDCVIKVEDSNPINSNLVSFNLESVVQYMNISVKGEDLKAGDIAVPAGTVCSMQTAGLLASLGVSNVRVNRKPAVSIFSTGNEIVTIDSIPGSVQIRDSNYYSIASFLQNYGVETANPKIIPDDSGLLKKAIADAKSSDCIIFTGGVSAGDLDLLPTVLTESGFKILIHKVKLKPGKPFLYALSPTGQAVFGLPGNPFSVQVTCKLFIETWIRKFMNLPPVMPLFLPITSNRIKKHKMEEYFPVKLELSQNKTFLKEIKHNGSGDIKAALFSDGLAFQSSDTSEIESNSNIPFYPWKQI